MWSQWPPPAHRQIHFTTEGLPNTRRAGCATAPRVPEPAASSGSRRVATPLFHVLPVSTTVGGTPLSERRRPEGTRVMTTQENSTHGTYVVKGASFDRDMNYIDARITRDGRDGWPVEAGRYRLIAARACPWAHRTLISRRLLGLEEVLSVGMPGPTHDKRSWTFDLDEGGVDPVLGYERLQQAYFARFPDYPRGITVPAVVDVPSRAVVTNDFQQ